MSERVTGEEREERGGKKSDVRFCKDRNAKRRKWLVDERGLVLGTREEG